MNKSISKKILALSMVFSLIFFSTAVVLPQAASFAESIANDDQGMNKIVRVKNSAELVRSLEIAAPGDIIILQPGTYKGNFKAAADGLEGQPIVLASEDQDNPAVLDGGDSAKGYTLQVTGDYWIIQNLKVTNAQKGIMLDNSNHTLIDGVEVYNIGMEAVHFRDGSSFNTLSNSNIHDAGVFDNRYGEGVYVGSDKGKWPENVKAGEGSFIKETDHNLITGNIIGPNVAAEHIDIKEGSTGTEVSGNIFNGAGISGANSADSFIDVKGNDAVIHDNVGFRNGNEIIKDAFQLHQQVPGWGLNAVFYDNTVDLDKETPFVINASKGTTAKAHNSVRSPEGNMYNGDVEEY